MEMNRWNSKTTPLHTLLTYADIGTGKIVLFPNALLDPVLLLLPTSKNSICL